MRKVAPRAIKAAMAEVMISGSSSKKGGQRGTERETATETEALIVSDAGIRDEHRASETGIVRGCAWCI